jgi:hypothetical protein
MWVLWRVQVCHHVMINQRFLHIQSTVVRSTHGNEASLPCVTPYVIFTTLLPWYVVECLPRNVYPQFAVCVMNLCCTFWCLAKIKMIAGTSHWNECPSPSFGTELDRCPRIRFVVSLTSLRSVIFWRTGYCDVHNIKSCFTGHYFIMTSAWIHKPDCKDSALLHLWVNCVQTTIVSSCSQLRIVLITHHICSSLRKAHDVTVLSIFSWHWTSEPECGEYGKLTDINSKLTKYFPTYVAVNMGLCCRKYYRFSISAAVYWKSCL